MFFQTTKLTGDIELAQDAVEAINKILEEEGVGYELSRPKLVDTGEPSSLFGHPTGNVFRNEFPQAIKKGERTLHDQVVQPALTVLGDPRLTVANSELLTAFDKVRNGDYADAITSCGAAFESILKTICDTKKWTYDPKGTCATLVKTCCDNGLFATFYVETFKGVGSVRNNLGDAHGERP